MVVSRIFRLSNSVTVSIELSDLQKFGHQIDVGLNGDAGNPVGKAVKQWAFRYRAWAQERFDEQSQGGGEWPDLKDSTKEQRRNKDKESISILRDTGILYAVLTPAFLGLPGQLEENIAYGVRIGFGGPSKHGDDGTVTVADIASFHHNGEGVLPVRSLIVEPPGSIINDMAGDMERAIDKLSNGN